MLNVVALLGRLTADPELKHTRNDISVTAFAIAVDRSFVAQGTERQADFINIVCWRTQAEFVCKYFKKGQLIAIDGSIQTRRYDDVNGNKRTAFEVVANNVHFAGVNKNEGQGQNRSKDIAYSEPGFTQGKLSDFEEINTDDELPF